MKSSNSNILIIFSLILFMILACSEGTVYQEPENNYTGIIKTDSIGKKLDSVDVDDDWTPNCIGIGDFEGKSICFYRVFPNPSEDTIYLAFASLDTFNLTISINESDNDTLKVIYDDTVHFKQYQKQIIFDEKTMNRNQIYRVYFTAKDLESGRAKTFYGDVMWK